MFTIIQFITATSDNGRTGHFPAARHSWRRSDGSRRRNFGSSIRLVIMGRKTFESLGKPLPKRINIVLTRHPGRLQKNFPELFADAWVAWGKTRIASPFQFELPRIGGVAATDLRLVKSFLKLSPADS